MTKSTITRERLQEIAEDGFLKHGESKELARMALAAMDSSESVELPLDYLQGHKDGLEWAAQLAESNHPETGDWLYDDPIELAKAIRKGPDMPEIKSVSVDEDDNFYSWFGRFWYENYQKNNYTTSAKQMLGTMAEFAFRAGRESETLAGNSPVIPDGYVMVPKVPTESMINAWLSEVANWRGHVAGYKAMLAAAPQDTPALDSVQSVVTVSDTWIPVSERIPENKPGSYKYLVFETLNNRVNHDYWNVPNAGDDTFTPFWNHYGEYVTHWMPLPSAPQQEVKP